jgi:hypothetical protein
MGNGVAVLLILFLCVSGVLYRPFESRAKFPATDWLGDWVSQNQPALYGKEKFFFAH